MRGGEGRELQGWRKKSVRIREGEMERGINGEKWKKKEEVRENFDGEDRERRKREK